MKVTDWLEDGWISEDVSETVVAALLTTCVVFPSQEYCLRRRCRLR